MINALAGKRAGYGEAYAQLQRDPCVQYPTVKESPTTKGERPFAYRLSGPLESKVCGVRLKRGYRLAFTMGASTGRKYQGCIEVLYVGRPTIFAHRAVNPGCPISTSRTSLTS